MRRGALSHGTTGTMDNPALTELIIKYANVFSIHSQRTVKSPYHKLIPSSKILNEILKTDYGVSYVKTTCLKGLNECSE